MSNDFLPGSFGGDTTKLDNHTRLECKICWYVYEPEKGDGYWQIPPGTPFSELPDDWSCPQCDGKKIDFMVIK